MKRRGKKKYWNPGEGDNMPKKKVRGFKNNAKAIAKRQGISVEKASAILASVTRNASAKAKKRNPRLKRVE